MMKYSKVVPKYALVTVALLAFACSLASAYDPSPLQDFCVAIDNPASADGEWVRVKPTPNAYIINVGDIVQVWSNDEYESVEHRAMVNSERERFSIPFFFNPAHYTMVKPLEELTNEQNPAKYRAYSWGK